MAEMPQSFWLTKLPAPLYNVHTHTQGAAMKTAQQKFNAYLEDCQQTRDAINELEQAARENHDGSYAYACGVYSVLLGDAISMLPKTKRDEMRQRILRTAQTQKNELLAKKIKDSDIQKIFDPAGMLK